MRIVDFFKRRPEGPAEYSAALAHERFQPDDLLKQAQEAEQAGFDGIACSDHLAPWWTDHPHAALRFYGERVLPELRSDS